MSHSVDGKRNNSQAEGTNTFLYNLTQNSKSRIAFYTAFVL